MNPYKTKVSEIPGTSYREVYDKAIAEFNKIKKRTKRRPYVRSAYFGKPTKHKIFFDFFWLHLMEKNFPDRVRRLRYFNAAIDLIKNSRNHPTTKDNPDNSAELVHRFIGITKGGKKFYVQIKETKRSGKKQLMSMFAE